ncbi:MAG: sugar phosphate nucleotidyltransferase [Solirubrobacteraceae bacterium]
MRASGAEVQALILAGGEGTRLRPLTSTVPKPVVPLAGRPFISYMVQWLRGHGVDDVILSCGFMAGGVREVLGDGSTLGVRLRYLEEPEPLGTGGALKFAEDLLDERFFMLNGDVLSDIDLTEQLAQHRRTGARATLALIAVEDPSAYGMVRRRSDLSVSEFVEKPGAEQIDINLINAGAYVLEREVLHGMASAASNISIEREVFPALVDHGLFGYEANGYWLDIGTPGRYLQATFDILEGNVTTELGSALKASEHRLVEDSEVSGRIVAPAIVAAGCEIGQRAIVGGRAVIGRGVKIGPGARVESSVLFDAVSVGEGSTISGSIIADGVRIGDRCHVEDGVVLGQGVEIGDDNVLRAGVRVFPGVRLPRGAIRF